MLFLDHDLWPARTKRHRHRLEAEVPFLTRCGRDVDAESHASGYGTTRTRPGACCAAMRPLAACKSRNLREAWNSESGITWKPEELESEEPESDQSKLASSSQ